MAKNTISIEAQARFKKWNPFLKRSLKPLMFQNYAKTFIFILADSCSLVSSIVLSLLINKVSQNGVNNQTVGIAIGCVALILGFSSLMAIANYNNNAIQYKAICMFRSKVYDKIVCSNTNVSQRYTMGEMLDRAVTSSAQIAATSATVKSTIFSTFVTIGTVFIALFVYSWAIALIVLAIYPLFMIVTSYINKKAA